jgi:serine acetyltransferase
VAKLFKTRGAVFPPIVHPTAILTPHSVQGEGLVMFPHSKLSVNSSVGDFVTILSSGVGHDVTVGDYTTISGMCSILSNATIGNRVFVAAGVSVASNVRVGDDAYLGLGSVILKDVPSGMRTFGNPARSMPFGEASNS